MPLLTYLPQIKMILLNDPEINVIVEVIDDAECRF